MTERTAQAKRCVRAKEKRKSGETDKPGDERICIWSVVVEKTREKKFSAALVGAKRVPDTFYRCQLCLLHFPLSYGINRTERIDASLPMEPNLANTCTPFSLRALLRRNSPMLATSRCFLRVTTQRNVTQRFFTENSSLLPNVFRESRFRLSRPIRNTPLYIPALTRRFLVKFQLFHMKIFPGQTARIGSIEYTLIREKILMGFCYAF